MSAIDFFFSLLCNNPTREARKVRVKITFFSFFAAGARRNKVRQRERESEQGQREETVTRDDQQTRRRDLHQDATSICLTCTKTSKLGELIGRNDDYRDREREKGRVDLP